MQINWSRWLTRKLKWCAQLLVLKHILEYFQFTTTVFSSTTLFGGWNVRASYHYVQETACQITAWLFHLDVQSITNVYIDINKNKYYLLLLVKCLPLFMSMCVISTLALQALWDLIIHLSSLWSRCKMSVFIFWAQMSKIESFCNWSLAREFSVFWFRLLLH